MIVRVLLGNMSISGLESECELYYFLRPPFEFGLRDYCLICFFLLTAQYSPNHQGTYIGIRTYVMATMFARFILLIFQCLLSTQNSALGFSFTYLL